MIKRSLIHRQADVLNYFLGWQFEPIANPRLGDDVLWPGWVAFQLAPKIADVDTKHVGLFQVGDAPDLFEYLGVSHDLAGVGDQQAQDVVFGRRKRNIGAIERNTPAA